VAATHILHLQLQYQFDDKVISTVGGKEMNKIQLLSTKKTKKQKKKTRGWW
jgi:hypothetical protein